MAKQISSETSAPQPLRVLMVDDSEDDSLLTIRELKKGGYEPVYERVETAEAMRQALQEKTWDVILCDYQMPQFNGLAAIALLKETVSDIPLIIVSGAIGEETAVACMRSGASDYIMKDKLSRLVPAIERELKEAESRSKRRRAEEAVQSNEARLRAILDATPFPIALVDLQDNIIDYWSHSALTLFGHTAPTTPEWYQIAYPDPDYRREVIDRWKPSLEIARESHQSVNTGEYRVTCRDGSVRICELYATFLADRLIVTFNDITDRKRVETELVESKALTEAVVENVPLMIFLKESTDLRFVIFNRAGEELLGHDRRDLIGKNDLDLFPPEQAVHFTAKDREVLDGEVGMLDIPEEPILTAKKGQRLLHTRKVCIRGSDGVTKFLLGISEDITERKRAENELQRTLASLRRAFSTTIQVMVSAVETRDPYTAGHQTRSADLARAIATEMGLPLEQIEGIRMVGSIHDIGKLSIPAEILSKPTKLSDLEFALIKEHARRGLEMLKDVESPWPLAEIVFQHHERMDGSGYPRNLKGEEICMEARILTVADVVEAMASHRPYRPGLGIDAALEEIEKNSGIFYDKTVADACLRLFREKGFKLEGA